jgi:hypothetical protein
MFANDNCEDLTTKFEKEYGEINLNFKFLTGINYSKNTKNICYSFERFISKKENKDLFETYYPEFKSYDNYSYKENFLLLLIKGNEHNRLFENIFTY